MSSTRPVFRHPDLSPNEAGYTIKDYEGGLLHCVPVVDTTP